MTARTSVSHDQAMVRELRRNPEFAAEYLRAALADEDEPRSSAQEAVVPQLSAAGDDGVDRDWRGRERWASITDAAHRRRGQREH